MGNDKRVGVPVFTNRKIKTTKSKTRQSDPESLSEKATSYNNISWGDKLYIVYSYFFKVPACDPVPSIYIAILVIHI